jgi:hypothetical protein
LLKANYFLNFKFLLSQKDLLILNIGNNHYFLNLKIAHKNIAPKNQQHIANYMLNLPKNRAQKIFKFKHYTTDAPI